jgi:hypothetical protein
VVIGQLLNVMNLYVRDKTEGFSVFDNIHRYKILGKTGNLEGRANPCTYAVTDAPHAELKIVLY